MNRVFAAARSIPKMCVRRISVAEVRHREADLSKIKQKQMHFQADDGTPIYLKGGFWDYVLFYTTIGLVATSLVMAGHSTYKMATKK